MKKITSFNLDVDLVHALKVRALELSKKKGIRVSASQLIEDALNHFGIKANKPK